jgi:hypothetical protein
LFHDYLHWATTWKKKKKKTKANVGGEMNLVVLSCFVIHSSNSYPTNELHIGRSIDAWNNKLYNGIILVLRKKEDKLRRKLKKLIKQMKANDWWPSNTTINGATLRRRVSWHTSPCSFHLGNTISRIISVNCCVFCVLLW